jgi:hypothetical protein
MRGFQTPHGPVVLFEIVLVFICSILESLVLALRVGEYEEATAKAICLLDSRAFFWLRLSCFSLHNIAETKRSGV